MCGFNDWLIRLLQDYRCHREILIQPDDRKKRKTDRRDAAALSELLWVNRDRLPAGKLVRGLRQVDIAASTDQANRRLTMLRKQGQSRSEMRDALNAGHPRQADIDQQDVRRPDRAPAKAASAVGEEITTSQVTQKQGLFFF